MSFELIPFKAWHIRLMNLRPWERKLYDPNKEYFLAAAEYAADRGTCFTGVCDEGIIGSGGIVPLFGTTHEVFVYATDLFPKYAKSIHSLAKKFLDVYFQLPTVDRIQAFIDSEHITAVLWAERLGFEYEGELRNYGKKGQDFLAYSKVKN